MGKIFYKGIDYSSPTSSGVSGVKGNKETAYRVGNVNITPANVGALAENGDSKDNTVTYTSADATTANAWTDVAVLATGEKHSSIFAKISTMFKNIRYIYTHFIKSENILETLEEIVANTQSDKVAGALAVKELNSNLSEIPKIQYKEISATTDSNGYVELDVFALSARVLTSAVPGNYTCLIHGYKTTAQNNSNMLAVKNAYNMANIVNTNMTFGILYMC